MGRHVVSNAWQNNARDMQKSDFECSLSSWQQFEYIFWMCWIRMPFQETVGLHCIKNKQHSLEKETPSLYFGYFYREKLPISAEKPYSIFFRTKKVVFWFSIRTLKCYEFFEFVPIFFEFLKLFSTISFAFSLNPKMFLIYIFHFKWPFTLIHSLKPFRFL